MDAILRAAVVYLFLLVLFRLCGKRTLAQITMFDFVLLLIISEATQQALIDSDNSMTNAALLVGTLIGLNILLSLLKQRSKFIERWLEDVPLVIVDRGKPMHMRMDKDRVDRDDILEAAREQHGIRDFDEIEYAVLERSGNISIIPKKKG
jgi:uncharacterized membrane protein YcaP (DUF421 family)